MHKIELLLKGPLDLDIELQIAAKLPLTLRRVERIDERAPDFRIDADAWIDLGYGWSQVSPLSKTTYLYIVIRQPSGTLVSGVAWQSPEREDRWFAQLQHVAEVGLQA